MCLQNKTALEAPRRLASQPLDRKNRKIRFDSIGGPTDLAFELTGEDLVVADAPAEVRGSPSNEAGAAGGIGVAGPTGGSSSSPPRALAAMRCKLGLSRARWYVCELESIPAQLGPSHIRAWPIIDGHRMRRCSL
jgi:hypothetical protein